MEPLSNKTKVVGVDISVARTTFAIVDIRGRVLASSTIPTDGYPKVDHFVRALSEAIIELCENNGGIEQIRSVGISCPSGNSVTGSMHNSPNMPWKGVVPLAALLRDHLGMAVALANDSEVIALGEMAFGSAHGLQTFAVVQVGSGVGAAFFMNRKIFTGAEGFAGELGHVCVVPNGRQCGCGLRGCLEEYVAGKGVVHTAQELLEESNEPSLLRDCEKLSSRFIAECCDKGDKLAIEVFRRTGECLGLGLANLATLVDPEAIVLVGGVINAGDWILKPTAESFRSHVFGNIRDKVKLMRSSLPDDERNLLGASALAWHVKEYSLFK